MTSSTLVKCISMIVSIVMPSYPTITFFSLVRYEWTLNHCSYSKHENQPQYFLNRIILNIWSKKYFNSFAHFTSLLTEHLDSESDSEKNVKQNLTHKSDHIEYKTYSFTVFFWWRKNSKFFQGKPRIEDGQFLIGLSLQNPKSRLICDEVPPSKILNRDISDN